MTDGHILKADVEFSFDAGPQVGAATHELQRQERERCFGACTPLLARFNPAAATYDVDERRQKDDDDGEDAHQGAVQPGLHDPFGDGLQRGWEKLGMRRRTSREEDRDTISRSMNDCRIYANQSTC